MGMGPVDPNSTTCYKKSEPSCILALRDPYDIFLLSPTLTTPLSRSCRVAVLEFYLAEEIVKVLDCILLSNSYGLSTLVLSILNLQREQCQGG